MEKERKKACCRAFPEGALINTFFCLYCDQIKVTTDHNDINCLDVSQEHADYDRIDQEADEWRARQIAKDLAQRKVLSHF
jgi:molybdenum cofactor biosynthesis enzyme MoaA